MGRDKSDIEEAAEHRRVTKCATRTNIEANSMPKDNCPPTKATSVDGRDVNELFSLGRRRKARREDQECRGIKEEARRERERRTESSNFIRVTSTIGQTTRYTGLENANRSSTVFLADRPWIFSIFCDSRSRPFPGDRPARHFLRSPRRSQVNARRTDRRRSPSSFAVVDYYSKGTGAWKNERAIPQKSRPRVPFRAKLFHLL